MNKTDSRANDDKMTAAQHAKPGDKHADTEAEAEKKQREIIAENKKPAVAHDHLSATEQMQKITDRTIGDLTQSKPEPDAGYEPKKKDADPDNKGERKPEKNPVTKGHSPFHKGLSKLEEAKEELNELMAKEVKESEKDTHNLKLHDLHYSIAGLEAEANEAMTDSKKTKS